MLLCNSIPYFTELSKADFISLTIYKYEISLNHGSSQSKRLLIVTSEVLLRFGHYVREKKWQRDLNTKKV